MSIQTELTRIINAKAAIKAAIEGKGVTVPDGTLLDGLAALIENIEAGGKVATGTFTVTEDCDSQRPKIVLTHNLGKLPTSFILYKENGADGVSKMTPGGVVFFATTSFCRSIRQIMSNQTDQLNTYSGATYHIGSEYVKASDSTIEYSVYGGVFAIYTTNIYRWYVS